MNIPPVKASARNLPAAWRWTVPALLLLPACFTGLASVQAADAPEGPAAVAPAAEAPAPGKNAMTVAEAIDGIVDEDEATRKAAIAALNNCTEADIPTLEKSADSEDPEIHRQVNLILKRLKRGEVAFTVTYPDGKPAAGLKLNVRLYDAASVQIYRQGKQVNVMGKVANNMGQRIAKEVFAGEFTTAADGKLAVGRFNDCTYVYMIDAGDPLPAQVLSGEIKLRQRTDPAKLELRRGVTVTVTVTDEDGKPVADASVGNVEDANYLQNLKMYPAAQVGQMFRQFLSATSDAKGVAVVEKTGTIGINMVAIKDGYDPSVEAKLKCDDGGTLEVALKLVKTKPVHVTMKIRTQANKESPETRILAIRQADVGKTVGGNWYQSLDPKLIDTYLENGAIDMATTDDKSTVCRDLLPDAYMIFAFTKAGKTSFSNIQLNQGGKDTEMQVIMHDLPGIIKK